MKRVLGFFFVHVIVWTALVYGVPGNDRLDYELLGDSSTPWVRQFIVALLAVLVLQIVFISRHGMWREVMADRTRSARWLMWIPSILIVFVGVVALVDSGISDAPRAYWIGMTITMVLVGLTEEITFRGILVVGVRRTGGGEAAALLVSSLLFGLFHLPNWLLGQDLVTTLRQVVFTAVVGAAFYSLRRASGSIVACIILHAAYDWVLIQGSFV